MHNHHILASSRFAWHMAAGSYRADEGNYALTIAYWADPSGSIHTYRATISHQRHKNSLRAESFNNLEDAVEWCEKQIPWVPLPAVYENIDTENIWAFLRRLGVRVS